MKYRIRKQELKECLTEAIKDIMLEDIYDDIIAQAEKMPGGAQKAALKDMGLEGFGDEEEDNMDYEKEIKDEPVGYEDMSDEELRSIIAAEKGNRDGAKYRYANKELIRRREFEKEKKDILNGEITCPVGYKIVRDETGKPVDVVPAYKNFGKRSQDAYSAQGLSHVQPKWGAGVSSED